ncbi:MAG: hypothetical protein GX651_07200, partial [Methanomicrobiales archaeon]|nr:hypothetical protein [Methanomicrobiales archaeon]
YVDLHKRYIGGLPPDLHRLVRVPADIPLTMKDEILVDLRQHDWKEQPIPDPTLLSRMVHTRRI